MTSFYISTVRDTVTANKKHCYKVNDMVTAN